MLLLKVGLMLGAGAALFASVASWWAGYPAEVAILRGFVAWAGISFVAFMAELVVATTPPPPGARFDPFDSTESLPPLEGDVTDGDEEAAA